MEQSQYLERLSLEIQTDIKILWNDLKNIKTEKRYIKANTQTEEVIEKKVYTREEFLLGFIFQYPEFYKQLMNYIHSHIDEFNPVTTNNIRIDKKAYDIKKFVDGCLLSNEEKKEERRFNSIFSVKTKYLEDGVRLQKLYNLIWRRTVASQ